MQRRKFLNTTAAASACVLAGGFLANNANSQEQGKNYSCKITILKKTLNEDYIRQYKDGGGDICTVFKEGQEFVVSSPWVPPDGFCSWAWADIRTYIHLVAAGQFKTFVACCTDGFRPVFFKLERIDI